MLIFLLYHKFAAFSNFQQLPQDFAAAILQLIRSWFAAGTLKFDIVKTCARAIDYEDLTPLKI